METTSRKYEYWVDYLRVFACLMVFVVHSSEPFYLGGEGSLVLTSTDAFWAALMDSLVRACVPIFLVASSYVQFPIHYSTGEFFRRRAVRILVPLLVWSIVYALVWGEPVQNLKDLVFNFNGAAGHLWFVYMLLGLYLIMPLLSPWARKVGKKELLCYIGLWLFTTTIPLIRVALSPGLVTTTGPGGMVRQALVPLWGEASWNSNGTFYYVSGLAGYLLVGLYFKKFVGELSWKRTLAWAIPLYAVAFAIIFGGFYHRVNLSAGGVFPVEGPIDLAIWWETTWCFDTLGVALMTIACILLFRKCTRHSGFFYERIVRPISKASYGMYLIHLLVLVPVCGFYRNLLGSAEQGALGFWTTPVEILLSAITAYCIVAISAILVQRIPKVGKYIMG